MSDNLNQFLVNLLLAKANRCGVALSVRVAPRSAAPRPSKRSVWELPRGLWKTDSGQEVLVV